MPRILFVLTIAAALACAPDQRIDDDDTAAPPDAGTAAHEGAPDGGASTGSNSDGDAGAPDGSSARAPDAGTPDAAPRIFSLTANPQTLTPGGSTVVSAVVGHPDGLAALAGGTLRDDASGRTLGAFSTPGGQGTFTFALSWAALEDAMPIDAATGATSRSVTATFFDDRGQRAEQSLSVGLRCAEAADGGAGLSLCSGACVDLATSSEHCGSCRHPAPSGGSCSGGQPRCPEWMVQCGTRCTDVTSDRANCGACGNDCTAWAIAHGASECAGADGGTVCPSSGNPICDGSSGTARCQLQIDTTSRVSCASLCQGFGLGCEPINVNGSCTGACAKYMTASSFQCSVSTPCGTVPAATHTCSGSNGTFSSILCGCGG